MSHARCCDTAADRLARADDSVAGQGSGRQTLRSAPTRICRQIQRSISQLGCSFTHCASRGCPPIMQAIIDISTNCSALSSQVVGCVLRQATKNNSITTPTPLTRLHNHSRMACCGPISWYEAAVSLEVRWPRGLEKVLPHSDAPESSHFGQ